jgi:hypothetical protein
VAFDNRDQAIARFKKDYSNTYTVKYVSEPTQRPEHIPASTSVGGRTVNIIYNRGYGGYGYMNPFTNAWIMYDVYSDTIMMDTLMRHHYGYYYPAYHDDVYVESSVGSALAVIGFIFLGIVVLGVVIFVVGRTLNN